MSKPSQLADERVRLIGTVVQQPDRTYRLEADCVPSDRPYMTAETTSIPLVWLAGERWPEGITRGDETKKLPVVIGGGLVTGTITQTNGRWFFAAENYGPPVWEL